MADPLVQKAIEAVADSAIDKKYGASSPEAHKMKSASRNLFVQALENGSQVKAPRIKPELTKEAQLRDTALQSARAADAKKDRDRER